MREISGPKYIERFYREKTNHRLLSCTKKIIFCFLLAGWLAIGELALCRELLDPPLSGTSSSAPASIYPEWWGDMPSKGQKIPCENPGSCVKCHPDNSSMDVMHAFSCVTCHLGNSLASEKDQAHQGLIRDPGNLDRVEETCGKCHADHASSVRICNMALAPRLTNHTRFAFGSQPLNAFTYGVKEVSSFKEVPLPQLTQRVEMKGSGKGADYDSLFKSLGDDLLRRSCLRCHLYTRGSDRTGEQRGQGCSACHVPYSNGASGKPYDHVIMKSIGITPCLKCHNSNHIGCDFVGLFEKDFNRGFSSPIIEGVQPGRIYGSEQHKLMPDVHYARGMVCSNCHTSDQLHGKDNSQKRNGRNGKVSCESCHVNFSHPLISRSTDGNLILKNTNDKVVPPRRNDILAHRIDRHEKLHCAACHAGWSFQDYGFHLMLDERSEYWMWSINASQNDPQIQTLLKRFVGDYAALIPPRGAFSEPLPEQDWAPPVTMDWISGEHRSGAWFKGFTMRRWSNPPLGLNPDGIVSVMRPMRQYVISWVKSDGTVILDSVIPTNGSGLPALIMNPYAPHTIQEKGKQCHECHGNPKAVGLGDCLIGNDKFVIQPILNPETRIGDTKFRWDAMLDQHGHPTQSSSHLGAGPLDPELFGRLLFPGKRFRTYWSRYLEGFN